MSYNNIQTKLETAALELVNAALPSGYTATTGQDDETQVANSVHVIAGQGSEVEGLQATGLYRMPLTVRVRSNANDKTEAEHESACGALFDAINVDDLPAQLSATSVSDFHCLGISGPSTLNTEVTNGESWATDLVLSLIVCGSDL